MASARVERGAGSRVRPAGIADLEGILRIENASFPDPWGAATFRGMMRRPDAEVLLLERDGELIGYAVYWWVGHEGELGNLAIAPEHRGRRCARYLLGVVTDRMIRRKVSCCYLEVREGNAAARELYRSAGYVPVGRRREYYRNPREDAIVMRRDIAPGRPEDEAALGGPD